MTAIILNEFTKPFYQKYFCWFIAIILAANAAMCIVFIEGQNTEFWQLPDGEYADRVDAVCAEAEKNKERLLRLDVTEHDYSYRYQDAVIDRYASLRDHCQSMLCGISGGVSGNTLHAGVCKGCLCGRNQERV